MLFPDHPFHIPFTEGAPAPPPHSISLLSHYFFFSLFNPKAKQIFPSTRSRYMFYKVDENEVGGA